MTEEASAVTINNSAWRPKRGELAEVGGVTVRVIGAAGSTITVRRLRWYERAWRWLTERSW